MVFAIPIHDACNASFNVIVGPVQPRAPCNIRPGRWNIRRVRWRYDPSGFPVSCSVIRRTSINCAGESDPRLMIYNPAAEALDRAAGDVIDVGKVSGLPAVSKIMTGRFSQPIERIETHSCPVARRTIP